MCLFIFSLEQQEATWFAQKYFCGDDLIENQSLHSLAIRLFV